MARPRRERLHLIFQDPLRLRRRLQKLNKRKRYSSRNRLRDTTAIISGLLADCARDGIALEYLLDHMQKLKDDLELGLKISKLPMVADSKMGRINEKLNELQSLVDDLLRSELEESKHTIIEWFKESCKVIRSTLGCITLELEFPSDGDFKRLVCNLIKGKLYQRTLDHIKNSATKRFEEHIMHNVHAISENTMALFEKCLSMCDIQLSCTIENLNNYLSKASSTISIKVEVSKTYSEMKQNKMAATNPESADILKQKLLEVSVYIQEITSFKMRLDEFLTDMELEKTTMQKEIEEQLNKLELEKKELEDRLRVADSEKDKSEGSLTSMEFSDGEDIFDFGVKGQIIISYPIKPCDDKIKTLFSSRQVYKMPHGIRGRCLIINNYLFNGLECREGSPVDVKNLQEVFMQLGFHVITKENLDSQVVLPVIEEELSQPEHFLLGLFVLILMSHGGAGEIIYGTDGVPINQHTILKSIYCCKALENKPKFIVIKACGGDSFQKLSENNADGSATLTRDVWSKSAYSAIPEDVLLLKSANCDFVSVRHVEFGSPFIRALVEALYKHAHHMDLETLCKWVQHRTTVYNNKVKREQKDEMYAEPIPIYISTLLTKKIYLFPGINTDESELNTQRRDINIEDKTQASHAELESSDEECIFDFTSSGKMLIDLTFKPCDDEMKSLFFNDKVYPMSAGSRGRCLIINNIHFMNDGSAKQFGSEIDAKNLANAFCELKFEIIIKNDLDSKMLIEAVEQEVSQSQHKQYGMFVLIIMTRGGSGGKLYGTDMEHVHRHDVLKLLYASETLRGKPKLVIMDAGDGDDLPEHKDVAKYHYDMAGPSQMNITRVSSPEDIVWLKSAMEGFASSKHSQFGSPFIRALVETLYKHAHHWDIKKIYKQVENKLRRNEFPPPEYSSKLQKKLFFFPNYDGE